MSAEGELPLGRRNGKSEAAFRTISEVADELDVPQHVLRFWESKFPQVKPLKRGGGRRYYRPEDVALLRRIRDLLYSEGYTIKGVQKLLREGGHKEAAPAQSDVPAVSPQPAPQPDLLQPLAAEPEEDEEPGPDFTVMDDGEEDDMPPEPEFDLPAAAQSVTAQPGRFSAETRQELESLLAELEQLRSLLQPR